MNEINEALGRTRAALPFGGKTWDVQPLDMCDMGDLKEAVGGLDALSLDNPRHQFEILYLVLRKADPDLTDAEREAERYRLTRTAARRMVSLTELEKPETQAFLGEVVSRSGLFGDPDAVGDPGGNAAESPAETDDDPKNGDSAAGEVAPPAEVATPKRSTRRSAG